MNAPDTLTALAMLADWQAAGRPQPAAKATAHPLASLFTDTPEIAWLRRAGPVLDERLDEWAREDAELDGRTV